MEIVYTDSIVAFIDVLGFSNLVFAKNMDPINDYFTMLSTTFKEAAAHHRIEYLLISDSIVIYCPSSKANLFTVAKFIGILQNKLLLQGIIVRGGIAAGNLFIDKTEDIVVGDGLVKAVAMEKKANYPRVVLDRAMLSEFNLSTSSIQHESSSVISIETVNGYFKDFPYIDYCRSISLNYTVTKFKYVIEYLRANYYNSQHLDKYEWLKSHLQHRAKELLQSLELKPEDKKTKVDRRRLVLLSAFTLHLDQL